MESQAKGGRYGSISDYIRDVIRRDQDRQDIIAEVQRLTAEGIESGVSTRTPDELLRLARRRAGVADS